MILPREKANRLSALSAFYQVSEARVAELAQIPPNERRAPCQANGMNPDIFRTMADYTRYTEARFVHRELIALGEKKSPAAVLDFGCLVSDYGLYFARLGSRVAIYDTQAATEFALYRFHRENLAAEVFMIPRAYGPMLAGRDLVIFGEVLEHMEDPLAVLQACVAQSVKYVFTSCYPFGDEKYFALNGHTKLAHDLQPACVELLKSHFVGSHLYKKAYLWRCLDQTG